MTRMEKMGPKIAKAREAKGMDVTECAKAIGISVIALECYERGLLIPQEPICQKISEILDIEISHEEYRKASWEDSRDEWNDGGDKLEKLSSQIGVCWKQGTTEEQKKEFFKQLIAVNDRHFSDEHKKSDVDNE